MNKITMDIISKSEAIKHGLNKYFPGHPCKQGHISQRDTLTGNCVECYNAPNNRNDKQANKNPISVRPTARFKGTQSPKLNNQASKTDSKKKLKKIPIKKSPYARRAMTPTEEKAVGRARHHLGKLKIHPKTGKPYGYDTDISEDTLGYTWQELRSHLSAQRVGYTEYRNRGRWHIDHIIPVSALVKRGVTEPAIINALSNLQLLTLKQNRKKSDSLTKVSEEQITFFIKNKTEAYVAKKEWGNTLAKEIMAAFSEAQLRVDWDERRLRYACYWYYQQEIPLPRKGSAYDWLNFTLSLRANRLNLSERQRLKFNRLINPISKGVEPEMKLKVVSADRVSIRKGLGSRPHIRELTRLQKKFRQAYDQQFVCDEIIKAQKARESNGFFWRLFN